MNPGIAPERGPVGRNLNGVVPGEVHRPRRIPAGTPITLTVSLLSGTSTWSITQGMRPLC
jgi:hypothetical protein